MLKSAIFADFLDFENGCCYLDTILMQEKKTHRLLAFFFQKNMTLLIKYKNCPT